MAEVLDSLPGPCPKCGSGPVVIDTDGADAWTDQKPKFWAYCDRCNHTCCHGDSPDEVAEKWGAAGVTDPAPMPPGCTFPACNCARRECKARTRGVGGNDAPR